MSEPHQLEQFAGTPEPAIAAEWVAASAETLGAAVACLLRGQLAVRVSCVGYGRALRLSVTDSRGWGNGWTLASLEELQALCGALRADGAAEWVLGWLEKPQRNRYR